MSLLRIARIPNAPATPNHVGDATVLCAECGALHWAEERAQTSSALRPTFSRCCSHGKVFLPRLFEVPDELKVLYTGRTHASVHFRNNIRYYNNAFSFLSTGGKRDTSTAGQRGIYTFKIQGQMYHRIGSLTSDDAQNVRFAQIYFTAPSLDAAAASRSHPKLDPDVTRTLETILAQHNPYAGFLRNSKTLLDVYAATGADVGVRFHYPGPSQGVDPRLYSLPRSDEVAAIVFDNASGAQRGRDLVMQYKSGPLQFVKEDHPSFLALRFPLLNPFGQFGWHFYIPLGRDSPRSVAHPDKRIVQAALKLPDGSPNPHVVRGKGRGGSYKVTLQEFYRYHLHSRLHHFSALFHAGSLLQEFIVDVYSTIEQNRLNFLRFNQKMLRSEIRSGVQDALMNGTDLHDIGTRVVLPASFTHGPRYLQARYHDAMALVREFKKPDLFITMTTNPKWPEIQAQLATYQTATDRPDVVARVFSLKLKQLLHLLTKQEIFGPLDAFVWSVEFQKRGLPHAHILITLKKTEKPYSGEDIDNFVCAELPDAQHDPVLHQHVVSHMIHGPCTPDQVCMQDSERPGVCSRNFPFALREETSAGKDGYPLYRRRSDGPTCEQHVRSTTRHIDSGWVVPYNPYLLRTFDCHINVEICTSIKAVKYLFKYIFKGPDRTAVTIESNLPTVRDEIKEYVDARYISACEGATKMFELPLHGISPSVMTLDVHLPDEDFVTFDPDDREGTQMSLRSRKHVSKLMAFFELCDKEKDATAGLTYASVPKFYTWNSATRTWNPRKQGDQIGRICFVPQAAKERFYLRMLLHHVCSPKSFEDLRKYGEPVYPTFRDACEARGLLADDGEWDHCLTDAAHLQTGASLRRLFCNIVFHQEVADPGALFQRHQDNLAHDCRYRLQRRGVPDPSYERCLSFCRALIRDVMQSMNPSLDMAAFGVPPPDPVYASDLIRIPASLLGELGYNVAEEAATSEQMFSKMNAEQQIAFNRVRHAIDSEGQGGLFFLDGPGGCGKTFVENALLSHARGAGKVALAVAASGIAALMLQGGRTAHSRFKIPLNLSRTSTCYVSAQDKDAELIRRTSVVIWDEAPMQSANGVMAVHRMFQDIRRNYSLPFGGAVVLFSGDWRQTLPVVRAGSTSDILEECLHQSPLWRGMVPLKLHQNLRLLRTLDQLPALMAAKQVEYAQWTKNVGDGIVPSDQDGKIEIPSHLRMNGDQATDLIDFVYDTIPSPSDADAQAYWSSRAILHAKNADVNETNDRVLDMLPGTPSVYFSADRALTETGDESPAFGAEYLATQQPSGSPLHQLRIKVGAPVMLLRNFDPGNGLCNGTRLIITHIKRTVLGANIITGAAHRIGQAVLLPRIDVQAGEGVLPFVLSRRQFPIKLCFAMTINKSQGQSLQRIGVDLRIPCFAHGQLYVALSRATDATQVRVLLPSSETRTRNVVISSALPHLWAPV